MHKHHLIRAGLAALAITLAGMLLFSAGRARAASIVVNTLDDDFNNADGDCNLREAIAAANTNVAVDACNDGSGADTITFSVTGTITLTGGEIDISSPMTITGPGAGSLTVSGNNSGRVFSVACCVVSISGMTITGGNENFGGGIYNQGTLTVTNSTVSGNLGGSGGAIHNDGTLTVTNSTISGNTAIFGGGGIYNDVGVFTMTGSLISGNIGPFGAGIYNEPAITGSVSANCIESNSGAVRDVHRAGGTATFDGNWWGVATGPNTGGETFGDGASPLFPASFLTARPACGPVASGGGGTADLCDDGRINCRAGDDYVVIYNNHDDHGHAALHVYCLTADGVGRLGLDVDTHDLEDFPAHPSSNARVVSANSALCRVPVQFWVLTTGEYQIVIGPDAKGDLIRLIFEGLPPSGVYVLKCNVLNSCNAQ